MIKKTWLRLLTSISTIGFAISCGSTEKKVIKISEPKNTPIKEEDSKNNIQNKIKELITEIKNNSKITTKYQGSNYVSDSNAIVAVSIFKKYGIEIQLERGTSKRFSYIGNKYGNVSYFINHILDKTIEELAIKTIEELASLFVLDPANDKYKNVKTITKNLKLAWNKKKTSPSTPNVVPTVPINTNKSPQANPRNNIIDSYYKDNSNLKESDSLWKIANSRYSETATKGLGQTYYKDLTRNVNGKWNIQFNLNDWINVYDTSFNEITQDPYHIYKKKDASEPGAPIGYKFTNPGFYTIFNNKEEGKKRTGNNNNGLNGLYSGALFEVKNRKKIFDVKTIFSFNGGDVVLGLTKNGKILLGNGWEHVTPASKTSSTFGESQKRPETTGFKYALGDLHNLRPSFQQLFNGVRSNYQFGIVEGDNNKYYGIDFEIGQSSFSLKVVEPRISVRGDIARIIFYMHDRYHIKYDLNYYKLLLLWARMDPVTSEELALDLKIKRVMGFSNDYVTGAKHLPYDQEVEAMIINANNDDSENNNTPAITSKVYWSRTPTILLNAIYVQNPINEMTPPSSG